MQIPSVAMPCTLGLQRSPREQPWIAARVARQCAPAHASPLTVTPRRAGRS
jgi:hypothetical protein